VIESGAINYYLKKKLGQIPRYLYYLSLKILNVLYAVPSPTTFIFVKDSDGIYCLLSLFFLLFILVIAHTERKAISTVSVLVNLNG